MGVETLVKSFGITALPLLSNLKEGSFHTNQKIFFVKMEGPREENSSQYKKAGIYQENGVAPTLPGSASVLPVTDLGGP